MQLFSNCSTFRRTHPSATHSLSSLFMQRITDIGQLHTMLAAYRRAQRLTQAELAQRLGVTKSRISQIENAPERVTVAQFLAVLRALKVEIQLVERPNPAIAQTPSDEGW
jgi:HTH-type transcriptional regulator / antitoxin HipB